MGRLHLAPRALVCKNAVIEGDVQIGNGTVVHVGASIIAKSGPIVIGANNIICERATIINNHSTPLMIGDGNLLETDSRIEGRGIGHRNIVQVRSKVTGSSTLGNNCVVSATCSTEPTENVPDNTVLYGNPQSRRTRVDADTDHSAVHIKHLEYIHEMLPRYNHIIEAE
ncbi:dynactin subunit 6 [Coemansia reversa NRRL 1564]|uniref:Dynactin subunit 6 n=1 Tax=Coemansia reversa (strain ATCC 12441 / NRRL 1564) TaxID=763665 RepID=A0A2G5BKV1_COERN|nr:dynactin subunit 6 [Coemansia reversa NRRL 1564]|eukprot:PIA19630.1 dynactin subunit 6 [Coemansia reversa NRRL 1564]